MPDSALPVIVAVLAAFGLFMAALGGVSLWSGSDRRK